MGADRLTAPTPFGQPTYVSIGPYGSHFPPNTGHIQGNTKADYFGFLAQDDTELTELVGDGDGVREPGETWAYWGGVAGERVRDRRVVYVAPADSVRGLSFDVVFVPGLAERLFPRKIQEEPILLDDARTRLGGDLETNRERLVRERLALRLAVGATQRRIVLSYPRLDLDQSRPRVPSFYALEALRAATGELPDFRELARRAEARLQMVFDPQTSGGLLLGVAADGATALRDALRQGGYTHTEIIGEVAEREPAEPARVRFY